MLAFSNTKFIVSTRGSINRLDKPVMHIKGLSLEDLTAEWSYYSLLDKSIGNINLANPINVFKLPNSWDRVFVATQVSESEYSQDARGFYKALRNLSNGHVPVGKDVPFVANRKRGELQITKYSMTGVGFTIKTNGKAGLIVTNQVYTHNWVATCSTNGRSLLLTPVNEIMMGIQATNECHEIVANLELE